MKRNLLLIVLGMAFSCGLFGCDEEEEIQGQGAAVLSVKSFALSNSDIDHVTVTVSGSDISPDIVAPLTWDGISGWSGTIESIPAGDNRIFLAQAFDAGNALLYSGTAQNATIVDGQTAAITVYLQQVDPPEPFVNAVPRFESLVLSSNQVAPTADVTLNTSATDPDGEELVYTWASSCGAFADSSSPSTTWTAPATEGICNFTISATDPKGASATINFDIDVRLHPSSGDAGIELSINTWPEVQGLIADPTRIGLGETTTLDLIATDADGDALTFAWTANCVGTFSDTTVEDPSFTLDADNGDEDCVLSVAIADGRDGSNTAQISLQTGMDIEVETNPSVEISPEQMELIQAVNDYRNSNGLPSLTPSPSLSIVGQAHVEDLEMYFFDYPSECGFYSWSSAGEWTACCYSPDHSTASCMYDKPRELTSYTGNGFEIVAWATPTMTPAQAISMWAGSQSHSDTILNQGTWSNMTWNAMGAGISDAFAVVWFGTEPDPAL